MNRYMQAFLFTNQLHIFFAYGEYGYKIRNHVDRKKVMNRYMYARFFFSFTTNSTTLPACLQQLSAFARRLDLHIQGTLSLKESGLEIHARHQIRFNDARREFLRVNVAPHLHEGLFAQVFQNRPKQIPKDLLCLCVLFNNLLNAREQAG